MKEKEQSIEARPALAARIAWLAGLLAALVLVGAIRPAAGQGDSDPAAPAVTGSIAFVNAATGDEIRLIEPNGSNNRRLWAHGLADPHQVYRVSSLSWRPNAGEIAFASSHENWCSLNTSDVFVVSADGRDYRRITQAPSCAGLSAFPSGTVRVPVSNDNIFGDPYTGFVYFQGAPGLQFVSLPPGGSAVVTFNNVADFGPNFLQVGAIVHGAGREISFATAVDVRAGQSVTTGQMDLFVPTITWEARAPTWRSNGSGIGYLLNFASMFVLPPHPSPLDLGQKLQTNESAMPSFTDHLAWGPPARAGQLLYKGDEPFDSEGIYLVQEYSGSAGDRLVSYETYEDVRGIAWLPDGSGFVYSVEEINSSFEVVRANIFEFNLATGQKRRLTNFSNQFAGQLSVSPDGTQIVFDRSPAEALDAPADLWIMNRDGSGQRLLVANGRAPAWSPGVVRTPKRAFLPALLGSQ